MDAASQRTPNPLPGNPESTVRGAFDSKGLARGALWLHALTLDTPSLLAGTQEVNLLVQGKRLVLPLPPPTPPGRLTELGGEGRLQECIPN